MRIVPLFSLGARAFKFMRGVGLILFASVQFAAPIRLFAQEPSPSPEPITVVVNLEGEEQIILTSQQSGSEQSIVPTVQVVPNQQASITLQFSSNKVGAPVLVGAYDGGDISGPDTAVVPDDGAVPFSFQPGAGPGTYRIMVQAGVDQYLLRFHIRPPD